VHEVLRSLPSGARVLDLGSRSGSFIYSSYPIAITSVDIEQTARLGGACFVQADAGHLPFAAASFDAVICNHSLEHFARLDAALEEIGRVLKRPGKLYVAVPDSSTLTDRLYRWLARGGGHVNAFASLDDLVAGIRAHVEEPLAAVRPLCTSLSFLNQRNHPSRPPRKLWLLGGGNEAVLVWLTYSLKVADRALHTRLARYGWALFFGEFAEPIRQDAWTNVCVRCGAGHPSGWLVQQGRVRKGLFGHHFACPDCGARNRFTADEKDRPAEPRTSVR
jgi:SAM-dependent methyltransferase